MLRAAPMIEPPVAAEPVPPREPLARLFLRFLAFGAMAWGGPVAQIAMLKAQLVEKERWISPARFHRALAVYQVLPGPEATELCVYFGMLSRGRLGGLLAGLGFTLPGLALMLVLSWAYVRFGTGHPWVQAAFLGIQAGVAALIIRAVHRIGEHAMVGRWLVGLALAGFVAQWVGLHFLVILGTAGLVFLGVRLGRTAAAAALGLVVALGSAAGLLWLSSQTGQEGPVPVREALAPPGPAPLARLFLSGLKAGLLSFGGAYTLIPFLRRDAVLEAGWLTDGQFLDGIALGGVLPAPLVIFGTFVGYLAGGLPGALVMTLGIFLPAFAFTLIAHDALERLVERPQIHAFLEGVTAAVVGMIAAVGLKLALSAVDSLASLAIFAVALAALYLLRHRLLIPLVVGGSAAAGLLLGR
ncbi:MAG: chromate efflux transporter [Myxococcota bacterium]|nr:chromate efflux transporter [Myxococcota bacterium]